MNLCIKKPGMSSEIVTDKLEMTSIECEALETLYAAGFQLDSISRVIDNANFALAWLNSADDKKSVVDMLELEKSCEGLIAKIDGEITAEAAVEGIGEALGRAWEAIKSWLEKLFTAVFNLIAAIFGADGIKDNKQKLTDLKETAPDADILAKADLKGSGVDITAELIKGRTALIAELLPQLQKNAEERLAAAEAYKKDLQSQVEMARLDERVKALQTLVDKSTELSTKYNTAMAELASKNSTAVNNNNNNILAGLTPAILTGFAGAYAGAFDPSGPAAKIAETTKKIKKVTEEIETETKKRKKKPETGDGGGTTPKPPAPNPNPNPPKPPAPNPNPNPNPKPPAPAPDPVTNQALKVLADLGKTTASDFRIIKAEDKYVDSVWGKIKRGAGWVCRKGWGGRNIKGNKGLLAAAREHNKTATRTVMLWALRLYVIDANESTIADLAQKIGTETMVIKAFITALRATGLKKTFDTDKGEYQCTVPDDATAKKIAAALKIKQTDVENIVKEANKLPDPKDYKPEEH